MKTTPRNKPITTAIRNYEDKKSGKVVESRNEIKRRFFGLDWKHQKRIIMAFLCSGAADRDWIYSRLLNLWDDSFLPKVKELWETYHEEKCTWIVIRHFPIAFLNAHKEQLSEGRNYYFLCRRLAAVPSFEIDKSRLSRADYVMALYHSGRGISNDEARVILYEAVRDLCFHPYPAMELNRFFTLGSEKVIYVHDFKDIDLLLYYLRKMNAFTVNPFVDWCDIVQSRVSQSDEYKSLVEAPLSEEEYKSKLAAIVLNHAYRSLPMTVRGNDTTKEKETRSDEAFDEEAAKD